MRFTVLGAGLQGSACAYDLLQNPVVESVRLADRVVDHIPRFLEPYVGSRLSLHKADAGDPRSIAEVMRGTQCALCAMPYTFNLQLAHIAVDERLHFADLGGNTDIVFQQFNELDTPAKERGVSVIPDCGLAPGLVNILAEMGIRRCDDVSAVRLFVGGLPQNPEPPLNYQLVYSLYGMLDYSTTPSWVLRDGARQQVAPLSERVRVDFPPPLGELEAFHTGGGLSTMAFRYEDRIPVMEYKTLRYPGHAQILAAIRDLGFFALDPISVNGVRVVPRDVAVAVMEPKLRKPHSPDLVALRVVVEGTRDGAPVRHEWELIDRYDAQRGISAMMRTTGYSLSITGLMQLRGDIEASGVFTPDQVVPGESYLRELAARGIQVVEKTISTASPSPV
jgi:lysine 6-dehydrogenase